MPAAIPPKKYSQQPQPADVSVEHLAWLVPARFSNEECSLKLYTIIEKHREFIHSKEGDSNIIPANLLAGACFALWRAVFLADNEQNVNEAHLEHVRSFLGNLIANNTIGYAQDRKDRNFTYVFYIQTARHRLLEIAGYPAHSHLVPVLQVNQAVNDDKATKDVWTLMQAALSLAIARFGELLDRESAKSKKQKNKASK